MLNNWDICQKGQKVVVACVGRVASHQTPGSLTNRKQSEEDISTASMKGQRIDHITFLPSSGFYLKRRGKTDQHKMQD